MNRTRLFGRRAMGPDHHSGYLLHPMWPSVVGSWPRCAPAGKRFVFRSG